MGYTLYIQHGERMFEPVVESDVQWETSRKGMPGKLTFKVVKDDILDFTEGDAVSFYDGEDRVFFGFVFTKSRDKDGVISVTAYDQLRYLKNKDTYVYENKTASEVVQMLAEDFSLKLGSIEDTKHKIESRVEDNQTLFDIIQNALDITLLSTKQMYVLYDDFGKLTLKNIESMKINVLIDENAACNLDYKTSIDGETYNQIKLIYENNDAGKREIYITKDGENINKWGVLQYFEKINSDQGAKDKADGMLKLYNNKTRNLTIKEAVGYSKVRAGSMIMVSLKLGDIDANSWLIVEKVTHKYSEGIHTMDLNLVGGVLNA